MSTLRPDVVGYTVRERSRGNRLVPLARHGVGERRIEGAVALLAAPFAVLSVLYVTGHPPTRSRRT